MSMVPRVEYWVMRVVLHRGARCAGQMDLLSGISTAGHIAYARPSDGFVLLGDACIAEPVEVFEDEESAHRHRDELRAKHPVEDFRVIMNGDMPNA